MNISAKLAATLITGVSGLTIAGFYLYAGHPDPVRLPQQILAKTPKIRTDPLHGEYSVRLSVLTYNVKGLPLPGRYRAQHGIASALQDLFHTGTAPDMVLLQEAFIPPAGQIGVVAGYPNWVRGPGIGDRMNLELPPMPDKYIDQCRLWKGECLPRMASGGLYLYSVYPIISLHKMPFGPYSCAGYDCLANKGVMLAVIVIPGVPSPVQILNTHLNSRTKSGVSELRSLQAHHRQIDEIATFIDEYVNPAWPLIYAGDFNTAEVPERYARFSERLPGMTARRFCSRPASACTARIAMDEKTPWLDSPDLQGFTAGRQVGIRPVRLEYLFDKPVNGNMPSDHAGYLVTYELSWDNDQE